VAGRSHRPASGRALVVVDTSVWADWFNARETREAARLEEALQREPVGVTGIIVAETLQGFRTDSGFGTARRILTALPMLDLDADGYVEAASLFRSLRRRGVTLHGVTDCVIAQSCIGAGAELLSADRDFVMIARYSALRLCAT
jgi:predicted nucleic acid-binding protein